MNTHALPTRELRHRWGDPVRLQDSTERTCELCGLVKITVHPPHGFPWREWRSRDATASIQLSTTPPCLPQGNAS